MGLHGFEVDLHPDRLRFCAYPAIHPWRRRTRPLGPLVFLLTSTPVAVQGDGVNSPIHGLILSESFWSSVAAACPQASLEMCMETRLRLYKHLHRDLFLSSSTASTTHVLFLKA
jgi:hypothetical protein